MSEFGSSGESAVSVAIALLELGLSSAVLAGAAEAHDGIVDAVLGQGARLPRGEGGGFVLLETRSAARSRGHLPLATLADHRACRGDPTLAFRSLPAPPANALVVTGLLPSPVAGALARSAWHAVRQHRLPDVVGHHEAMGAAALAVAVGEVARGGSLEVLVVTAELDTVYLTRVERAEVNG